MCEMPRYMRGIFSVNLFICLQVSGSMFEQSVGAAEAINTTITPAFTEVFRQMIPSKILAAESKNRSCFLPLIIFFKITFVSAVS